MPGNKKPSVKLVWDGKNYNLPPEAGRQVKDLQQVFPCPVYTDRPLFVNTTGARGTACCNLVFRADNLDAINTLLEEGYKGKVDLIYIDPPYFSENEYRSKIILGDKTKKQIVKRPVFRDTWEKGLDSYLDKLLSRLIMMRELLSPEGSIFVHLDWHTCHYVKVLMDEIFGSQRFINEIVWCYGGGSGTRRHFHRKHDIILWYSRSKDYIFNPQYRPYSKGTVQRGLTRVKGDKYRLHEKGALMQDWWTDINKILSPTAMENLKFPTQKPASLLARILAAASNQGSRVADFYSGSGTTAQVAEEMGRDWIISDTSGIAIQTSMYRLIKNVSRPFIIRGSGSNNSDSAAGINVKAVRCDQSSNFKIKLEDYQPGGEYGENLPAGSDYRCFINFWEVDLDYDGDVFHSDIQVMRSRVVFDSSIPREITVAIDEKPQHRIAIKVHDVLGNCQLKTIKIPPV